MKANSSNPPNLESSLTVHTSSTTDLNKEISIVKNEVIKSSVAWMSKGTYETIIVSGPEELNDVLNNLKSNQAVSIGICNKGQSGKIKSKKSKKRVGISRSKDNFDFSNCFVFDIDGTNLAIEQVLLTLYTIDPNLKKADILVRVSSSYGIHKIGEKPKINGCGYHVWVFGVFNPSDIKRYGKDFAKLCWLAGNGFIKISKSGSMLVRQLIDVSVFSPERLVFEASPTLGEGLEQLERPYIIQYGDSNV